MKQSRRREHARRLPLSVRLSLLILFAAILPLAAVVGINDFRARETLEQQGRAALTTDARAKEGLIDTYVHERFLDGAALASLPTAPAYLACIAATALPPEQAALIDQQLHCSDPNLGVTFYQGSNQRALCVGLARDPNYTLWSLFIASGTPLLSFSPTGDQAQPCKAKQSGLAVPKEDLARVKQGKAFTSAVYYDASGKFAYINLYTPIMIPNAPTQVLGFLQARLKLDYIWNIVKEEQGANGSGSYAFITDENSVRVADAHREELFSAVQPLDATTQQLIASEQRFGANSQIKVANLPGVASALKTSESEGSFQAPATPGSAIQYQYVHSRLKNIPWTYFVLSPLTTVTAVADNQVRTSLLSAGFIALLAILLGLLLGRRMSRPVHAASEDLQGAAVALKLLATRQESSAGEQQWVVDACKTGLESVRYLADAMNQAAGRIIDASNWFGEYWDRLTEEQARRTVQHLQDLARYVDEAARRQHASSDRLGKAITVTTQVSDQLVAGASAAKRSADQLEEVVGGLQRVVGGRSRMADLEEAQAEQIEQEQEANFALVSVGAGRGGYPEMPGAQMPRQLAAPMDPRSQASPRSQMPSQWSQMGGYAPRAPYGPYNGARRPGESQAFDATGDYTGYGGDPRGAPSHFEWDQR